MTKIAMPITVDYYFSPISGYAYLGHGEFLSLSDKAKFNVRFYPIDIVKVFASTNTTPPAKQADARKSYRTEDMARYAQRYNIPINLHPKHWPVPSDLACKAIIACKHLGLNQGQVTGVILKGVWAQDADIADINSLQTLLNNAGLPGVDILSFSEKSSVELEFKHFTQTAINNGIFGSPTYLLDKERFWGQDRLAMLQERITLYSTTSKKTVSEE